MEYTLHQNGTYRLRLRRSEFTIFHQSELLTGTNRYHNLDIYKRNSVANTEELLDMISGDSLIEAKQLLETVSAFPGGGRDIECDNCGAKEFSSDERIELFIDEPDWSNCAGCELK